MMIWMRMLMRRKNLTNQNRGLQRRILQMRITTRRNASFSSLSIVSWNIVFRSGIIPTLKTFRPPRRISSYEAGIRGCISKHFAERHVTFHVSKVCPYSPILSIATNTNYLGEVYKLTHELLMSMCTQRNAKCIFLMRKLLRKE